MIVRFASACPRDTALAVAVLAGLRASRVFGAGRRGRETITVGA